LTKCRIYDIIKVQKTKEQKLMKTMTITIKPTYKETREQRLERVRNDKANRCCVHASKKAYKRQDKHKQQYYI
jgi:cation transport regulator ChaB